MTVEELKVRLCEEIKFNNDGYNNMCEVLEEFSDAQKTAHNSEYAKCKETLRLMYEAAMDADICGELYDSFDGELLDMAKDALK